MDNLIKELDLQAQKHISGGFWDWVVGTFLGGMLYDLTFHTGETIESFNKKCLGTTWLFIPM